MRNPPYLIAASIAVAMLLAACGSSESPVSSSGDTTRLPELRRPTPEEVTRYGVHPEDGVVATLTEIPGKPHDYVATEFLWRPYVIHYQCTGTMLLIQELHYYRGRRGAQGGPNAWCDAQSAPSGVLTNVEPESPPLPQLGDRIELSVIAQEAHPGWGVMLVAKSYAGADFETKSRPPTASERKLFRLPNDAVVLASTSRDPSRPFEPSHVGFPYRPYRLLIRCAADHLTPPATSASQAWSTSRFRRWAGRGPPLSCTRSAPTTARPMDSTKSSSHPGTSSGEARSPSWASPRSSACIRYSASAGTFS